MSNVNASILYCVLDADEYNGGVSGIGAKVTFSAHQMEKAMDVLLQFYNAGDSTELKEASLNMDEEQILNFLLNCLKTAKEEEEVVIVFC